MNTSNPFEVLNTELSEIKGLLLEMKASQMVKEDFAEFPELMSRAQAAKLLGIVITTVDKYTSEGILRKHRNGKTVRFKKSEVIAAFKSHQKWQRGF